MISYEPLFRILKGKSISLSELEKLCNKSDGAFSTPILKGSYLRTNTIELICNTLNCQIQDIICYSEKAFNPIHQKINWDNLCQLIKASPFSMQRLSLAINRSGNYLNSAKGRNGSLAAVDIEEICKLLSCKKEYIVEVQ